MIKLSSYHCDLHSEKVVQLFRAIYPVWSERQYSKMAYRETHPLHVKTLLAVDLENIVGQINIFRICGECTVGNVGYHVHPTWQRKGIGSLLLKTLLAESTTVSGLTEGLVVQTSADNVAALTLARNAGFINTPKSLIYKHSNRLKFSQIDNGCCLYLPFDELQSISQRANATI